MRLGSTITIGAGEITKTEATRLISRLTFIDGNDEIVEAWRYSTRTKTLILPRGIWRSIPGLFDDERTCPPMPKVDYVKHLGGPGFEGQVGAVKAMVEKEQGQVIAPPGEGKTEIGLAFAAGCKTRTLVVVHTKDLFDQWVQRAAESVPGMKVGMVRGKTFSVEHLTIAMAQTLKQRLSDDQFWQQFGCLIIDEAHHSAATTWEYILNACPAKYRFGLTATATRADKRHPLVGFLVGPVIYQLAFRSRVPITVQPVETAFKSRWGGMQWPRMMRELCANEDRNRQIAQAAIDEFNNGRSVLVLSRQIKHLEHIYSAIQQLMPQDMSGAVKILSGQMTQKDRLRAIENFRDGTTRVVLATQLADEGLDIPRISCVMLTFPGKHDGRIIQQVGRSIRTHADKTDSIIYDFVDSKTPSLARQYLERMEAYKQMDIPLRKAVRHGSEATKRRISLGNFRVRRSRGA